MNTNCLTLLSHLSETLLFQRLSDRVGRSGGAARTVQRQRVRQPGRGLAPLPPPSKPKQLSHPVPRLPLPSTGVVQVAALYVANGGCYSDLAGVEPWDEARDARLYKGPWPVVAHPPCQRWGRFWHGSTRKPHQFKLGDDNGCFAAALAAVRQFGGVLEHPEASHAWRHFGLNAPPRQGGWIAADFDGGWTCCVYQGHYGHFAGKGTWLYAYGVDLPELHWGKCEQRLHPVALAKHGYEKARRIGMMAMVGGKDKTRIRNTTPVPFRDLLIGIVRTASLPLPSTGVR